MSSHNHPHIVVIGAGFGGLSATKQLAKAEADILLIDRQNFHLFTPLLYQVATSGLEPGEIAYPIRGILRNTPRARFLLGNVEQIDTKTKIITVQTNSKLRQEIPYDHLIIAAGSQTHFFNISQIEQHAFGLKSLADGVVLRNHLLKCFERAAWSDDPARKVALTTMVVVGGGPTGLETAGALQELCRYILSKEYASQLPNFPGRVVLVEMQNHLLSSYPGRLQTAARKQLEELGVEVILGQRVVEVSSSSIRLSDGTLIPTHTLIWAAGVKASPLAEMLSVPLSELGQVPVLPTMEAIGIENVYVVGDMAYLEDKNGKPYPMVIPVAKQQGTLAAKNIMRQLENLPQQAFSYSDLRDRGIMATIGRSRAVAWIFYKIQLTGFIAWLAWLGLHLITLLGFRNRLNVLINWVWNYFTYDRSVRIILEHQPHGPFVHNESESTLTGNTWDMERDALPDF